MATIRLGKRTDARTPKIKEFVPLAELKDLVFGGWDIFEDDAYKAAANAGVLDAKDLAKAEKFLKTIKPMKAAFDQNYVKLLSGTHVKNGKTKFDLAEQIREDIRNFKKKHKLDRLVMVWCGSTEIFLTAEAVHKNLASFEKGMKENHPAIAPSMLYAYAAISEGVPYANGAPNLSADIPALIEYAKAKDVPIVGKDFKTGQTLMKTILSPGFKARMLGLSGWFSTNILGNRDGEVLEDPGFVQNEGRIEARRAGIHFAAQALPRTLRQVLSQGAASTITRRSGDNKEGWDDIDIFGWLGYPMQIKVDFLCRDSILAAPIVLDLVLFLDLAKRAGLHGIQEWFSFYFKSPMCAPELYPEHDIFIQLMKLKNTLRWMMGEDLITHLGAEYYD